MPNRNKNKHKRQRRRNAEQQKERNRKGEAPAPSMPAPNSIIETHHSTMSTPPDPQKTTDDHSKAQLRIERKQMWFNGILAACAVIGVAIGGCQGWAIWEQIKIANQAVGQTEKSLDLTRQEQRAWLAISKLEFEPPKVGVRFSCRVHINNTGHAPAEIYKQFVDPIMISEQAKEFTIHFGDEKYIGKVDPNEYPKTVNVAPGGTVIIDRTDGVLISQKYLNDIENGDGRLAVTVRILYRIQGQITGVTRADFVYDPKIKDFRIDGNQNQMR